jgi:cellulose synthase/poly-beta-1,6-N-acetylglucosamine synthase-like glycosyltransferase
MVRDFVREHRHESAVDVILPWQVMKLLALLGGLLLFFLWDYKLCWTFVLCGVSLFYLLTISYKLVTVLVSLLFRPELHVTQEELAALDESTLPVYTILLPMYKEAGVVEKLVHAIDHLDYPHDRLDIKLLLEEDDHDTVARAQSMELPACCQLIVVANSFPKTKPKACNHGLLEARGEYVVIYDAEDVPEPDQLKKAVLAFQRVPPNVVCLQGKLNYYNPNENSLTKWFAMEYTTWFDLFLPGLHKLGVPIPLGGTSNHFKTRELIALGAWDPFNVTEDCDLGIRIHRQGYRTQVLDSTTWEEANEALGNWIRQRSRWVKGYFQTHLVHSRSTLRTIRELGLFGYLSFLLTVGGLSITLILNPIFWCIVLALGVCYGGHAMGLGIEPWQMIYFDRVSDIDPTYTLWSRLSWVFFGTAGVLFLANFVFVLLNVLACMRRRLLHLLPFAFLSPIYWIFISIAAWKGFLQLFFRPFYWEKTEHGLTEAEPEEAASSSARFFHTPEEKR